MADSRIRFCPKVICMVVVGLHTSDCTTIKWKVGKTIGVRFLNPFAEKPHHSHTSCVHLCLAIGGCFVANYHPGSRTCALVDGSQTSNAYDETWHAYEVISETRLQTQSATQSSTVSGHLASYAIDNKLSTNLFVDDCAHTGGPGENFWQTELATYTAVRRVMLYLRSDFGNDRNRYLTVMVCKTANECGQNAGAVCATYPGPPADPTLPVTLNCEGPLPGKFLRVRQQIPGGSWLTLCEVIVYSH